MPTRLILIRHGESEDNIAFRLSGWTDSRLTPTGVEQAWRMARYVVEAVRLDALYASPLTRAVQTAEPLARLTGLTINLRDDLRELYFGDAEGLTIPEIEARFPEQWQRALDEEDVGFSFPNGEVRACFYERIQRAFREVIHGHPDQTVAIVSHGGVLSSFLAAVSEGRPQFWRRFYKDNCSLSEVVADNGSISIVRWNVTDHLR